MSAEHGASDAWRAARSRIDLDEYDARWDRLAAHGELVHGEADLVAALDPASVLDAGCGTGRVAIELARRGIDVVGVDGDPDMLARARRKAPHLVWVAADLAVVDLGRTFDVVVMAGNVLPFVDPPSRPTVVASCAGHLAPGGLLVTGAGLHDGWPGIDDYDEWCAAAGLVLERRFATWDRQPWAASGGYAVSIHGRAVTAAR
ncbi:MAG: class I SAM-dependent methyltransferase [Ilumatobacteraceae bacterium]